MGTNSLQAAKKRSFHLPSFRLRSSAGERQEPARNAEERGRSAEEVAQVQKAAAWQWYTRGVGEAVVPTKRPPVAKSQAPASDDKNGVNGSSKGGESIVCSSNVQQKKTAEPPRASESLRAASRFKAEASFTLPTGSGAHPTPLAPAGGPSTPLYDDFDLSGLRTQMSDFVQRLENQHSTTHNEQQKSKPPPCPSTPSVSIDHRQTKAPSAAAASSTDHLLTKLPPASAVPVASTIPLHMRPLSAVHRFFRKVVSGSIKKSTKNSPQLTDSATAVYEPEVLIPEDQNDDATQYHHHHYIHHHHHHYHYAQSPEERAMVIRSTRRHSESSGIRPHIPSLWEAESDEEEDEPEGSPIKAYLARRRRHSDSFPGQIQPKKADFDEDEGMKEESVKAALPMQFSRRYSSERFSPNKIPTMVNREIGQPAAGRKDGSFDEFLASRIRTRHSAEYCREEASLERKADQGGGKSAGGAYKLGGGGGGGGGMQATSGGRKSPGGAGGAAGGGHGMQATPVVRRRHSEGSRRPVAAQYEMGKRSPSARYHLEVRERHIGIGLPPLYPQKPLPS